MVNFNIILKLRTPKESLFMRETIQTIGTPKESNVNNPGRSPGATNITSHNPGGVECIDLVREQEINNIFCRYSTPSGLLYTTFITPDSVEGYSDSTPSGLLKINPLININFNFSK